MERKISCRGQEIVVLLNDLTLRRGCSRSDVLEEAIGYVTEGITEEDLRRIARLDPRELPITVKKSTPMGAQLTIEEADFATLRKRILCATSSRRLHNSYIIKVAITSLWLSDHPDVLEAVLAPEEPIDTLRLRIARRILSVDTDRQILEEINALLKMR